MWTGTCVRLCFRTFPSISGRTGAKTARCGKPLTALRIRPVPPVCGSMVSLLPGYVSCNTTQTECMSASAISVGGRTVLDQARDNLKIEVARTLDNSRALLQEMVRLLNQGTEYFQSLLQRPAPLPTVPENHVPTISLPKDVAIAKGAAAALGEEAAPVLLPSSGQEANCSRLGRWHQQQEVW